MGAILHHLRHPGTMMPLEIPRNVMVATAVSCRGAKWILSIHTRCPLLVGIEMHLGVG